MQYSYIDIVSVCIAAAAMVISFFTLWENKKLRQEQGQARIFVEVMQMNFVLYLVIHNIGGTYANNVNITVSEPFVNRFSSLSIIPPGATYRYSLLDAHDINLYPAELHVAVSYHDRYRLKKAKKKSFKFKLINCMQYDLSFNEELKVYEISKTY